MQKPLLTCIAILFCLGSIAKTPVEIHGALHVDGTQLSDKHHQPVVLRGMSFGWHCFWPRFYNEGAVNWLASDWGCNVVRAAMGIEPPQGYLEAPEWSKKQIKAVVDAAIKKGIYVIIDWHSHNIQQKQALAFFTEMANLYGKYPNVIYEVFNEPDQESWADVKAYSEAVIKSIRAVDPDNIILVGCPRWDQEIQLPAADPIKGYSNLMYTVHYYAATHKGWLRDRTDEALKKGLPIFISECAGMEASGNGKLDLEEWQLWINWCEQRKISWITWSVSDKNETCSVLLPSASSNGNWQTKDLKESGIKAREYTRKPNGVPAK